MKSKKKKKKAKNLYILSYMLVMAVANTKSKKVTLIKM